MRRQGFTVIELLIVITIMMAITAMAIPVLAPSREERRVLESTRIVTSMFAGARARAIEIGRPVGVGLERSPATADRSITLYYAEVPPPWCGGFTDSRIVVEGEKYDASSPGAPYSLGDSFTDWNGNGVRDSGGFVTAIIGGNPSGIPGADVSWLNLIRPGDSIRLNYRGYDYTIGLPQVSQANYDPKTGYINKLDQDNPWELATAVGGAGVTAGTITDAIAPPHTPNYTDSTPDHRFIVGTDVGGQPFQITRQAYRSAAQTQTLPETMCIDLTASNTSADVIQLMGFDGDVTIMFNPGGSMDSIRWSTGQVLAPSSPLFLLVGKTALVGGNVAPKAGEAVYNWQDFNNRWVLLNHQSGLVASNPPALPDMTQATPTQITQSRLTARTGIKVGDK